LAGISASSAGRSVCASATNGKGENPPVGLILCAQKDESVARYALEGLPNKVMASEYRTALPDEKELAAEIERTQVMLRDRKRITLTSSEVGRMKKKTKKRRKEKGNNGDKS
jgi:hypothetical protein